MLRLNSLSIGLLSLFIFSPLLYFLFIISTGLTFTIVLRFFSIFVGLIFILKYSAKLNFPNYLYFIIIFFIYRLLWLYFGEDQVQISLFKYFFRSNELATFFILLIVINTVYTQKFIKITVLFFKIIVIFSAIVSIVQVVQPDFLNIRYYQNTDDWNLASQYDIYRVRRTSIFGFNGPNALGLSFIPLLSVLIGHMLMMRERNIWFFLILGGIVAGLSNTRYVMVGFLIVLVQILVASRMKLTGAFKYSIISIFSIIAVYYTITLLGYKIFDWIDTRLLVEGSLTETSRYKSLSTFNMFFPQNPLFGTGHMTDAIISASMAIGSSHIHVGYLSHLVVYGIIGCFFLFGYWFMITRSFFINAKRTNYWGAFFGMLIFLWSFATMSESSIFFQGLIFAFVFDKYYHDLQFQSS